MAEVMNTISSNLRAHRAVAKLSRRQLSEATGIPQSTIAKWENGEVAIPLPAALNLADFYGVSVEQLCGRTETR